MVIGVPPTPTPSGTASGIPATPTATPATAAQAPATPTPTPAATLLIKAALEQVRISRIRHYGDSAPPPVPAGGIEAQRGLMHDTESGMVLRFRLLAPPGWDIVAINQAWLQQVVDSSGKPLLDPEKPIAAFTEDMSEMRRRAVGSGASIELTSPLPDRATSELQSLTARFDVSVGQRLTLQFSDVRSHVGKLLIGGPTSPTVTLKLLEFRPDLVALVALGEVERIGRIDFYDPAGKLLTPYATELQDAEEAGPDQPRKKLWQMSFDALPQSFNIRVDLITDLRRGTIPITLPAVPLP
jgi:hypothetical protein